MSEEWYYGKGGKRVGPISMDELSELASSGHLSRTDLVWTEGMSEWVRAETIKGLFVNRAIRFLSNPVGAISVTLALCLPIAYGVIMRSGSDPLGVRNWPHGVAQWFRASAESGGSTRVGASSTGRQALGFDPMDFDRTLGWANSICGDLERKYHANEFLFKTEISPLNERLKTLVGKEVRWNVPVKRVTENSVILTNRFPEEDANLVLAYVAANDEEPKADHFWHDVLDKAVLQIERQILIDEVKLLRAGGRVTITGKIYRAHFVVGSPGIMEPQLAAICIELENVKSLGKRTNEGEEPAKEKPATSEVRRLEPILDANEARPGKPVEEIREPASVETGELELSAAKLSQDFMTNEPAAIKKYKGKGIQINGTVTFVEISRGSSSSAVDLKGSSEQRVRCFFEEKHKRELSNVSTGQTITVRGRCDTTEDRAKPEFPGGPEPLGIVMWNCYLVEAGAKPAASTTGSPGRSSLRSGGDAKKADARQNHRKTARRVDNRFAPDSPEGIVDQFLTALANKDKGFLANLVHSKALGDLAKFRDASIDDTALEKLATSYGKLYIQEVVPVTRGDERVVVVGTESRSSMTTFSDKSKKPASGGGLKQVTLRKEGGIWRVLKLPD